MPGHPIPEPYCWSEEFKVFYETLDAEHKGLFEGIFACNQARGDAGALAKLQKAVKDHFATEEAMLSKAGYAEFADHKKLHDNFVSTLDGVKAPIGDDTIKFAMQWLVDHIKDTDFKYKGKLN